MSGEAGEDIEVALERARDRLRKAEAARVAAEAEHGAAVKELYETHMATFGSDRYKRSLFAEDLLAIRTEVTAEPPSGYSGTEHR